MLRFVNRFSREEEGAITVDWVVLTAMIIGLGSALFFAISTATDDFGGNVNTALTSATISTGDNDNAGGITVAGTAGGSSGAGSSGGSSSGGSSSGSSSSGGSSSGGGTVGGDG